KDNKKSPPDNKKSLPKILLLEGIIYGEPTKLDDALAMYLMKLEGSPLFSELTVNKTALEDLENKKVLHFWTRLNLG
ncbi:MAG: hypothetical protein KJ573_13410, partial [Proteobacteria bacterium]|nr:hypothetical protein [Pseudomonadota bacterium]MBU1904573.1 hypothetical protein [Pseudomonadota bacterium]